VTKARGRAFESIAEAEVLARRRLPPTLYSRTNVGSDGDATHQANLRAYGDVTFRPRAATFYPSQDISVRLLGKQLDLPVLLAPTAGIRLVHPVGELGAARGAGAAGTAYAVSMFAGFSIEEVAAAGTGPLYQQVYMANGRAYAEDVIMRAASAGYSALVLTVDVPVMPHKADQHPLRADFHNAIAFGPELVRRPGWFYRFARDGMPFDAGNAIKADPRAETTAMTATWADMKWIRELWSGPIVVKGVVTGADALRAVDSGADAVVVSNHGGKGLDSCPATMRALPEVVKAVGGTTEVLLDGGVRSGSDVVKAIALGAKAVLIGRPYIWGLAVDGEEGVRRVLDVFAHEIARTLALLGCPSVAELDQSFIDVTGGLG
jgi:isopentenyl diphosphate isomerase/L-lactate dehydrogenase-like FMN-dependent dehydrogenase